jgi:hypothetical protein
MKKEAQTFLAAALLTATLSGCGDEKKVSFPEINNPPAYLAYKIKKEQEVIPNLTENERSLYAALGCSLWQGQIEGSCGIVNYHGEPTVLTIGHVVQFTRQGEISMYIPGSNDVYKLNPNYFQRFGNGDDPPVIYDISSDSDNASKLNDLVGNKMVEPLNLITDEKLVISPSNISTLNPFNRNKQTYHYVSDSENGEMVLQGENGAELCHGDSGINFIQEINGINYVVGVNQEGAPMEDKTVDGVAFRCAPFAKVSPTYISP